VTPTGLTAGGVPVEWWRIPTGVENGKGRDMGKTLSGRVVRAVMLFVVAVLFAGCQQPETPNERQARLLAAENMQLKKRLQADQARMEALEKENAKRIQRRDEELARSQARTEQLQQDLNRHIDERVRDVTKRVIDENARLRKETEQLQAEIKKLESDSDKP
jgi:gas vesicle protein